MKIIFLCHGNICRSPMAEFVMKHLASEAGRKDLEIESAALHNDEIGSDIHSGTRRKLVENNIPFSPRRAWRLTREAAAEADLLVAMDDMNVADLRRLVAPQDQAKIRKLLSFTGENRNVADPWYTGDFDATYADILAGCKAILATLAPAP